MSESITTEQLPMNDCVTNLTLPPMLPTLPLPPLTLPPLGLTLPNITATSASTSSSNTINPNVPINNTINIQPPPIKKRKLSGAQYTTEKTQFMFMNTMAKAAIYVENNMHLTLYNQRDHNVAVNNRKQMGTNFQTSTKPNIDLNRLILPHMATSNYLNGRIQYVMTSNTNKQ
eukprot:754838_1